MNSKYGFIGKFKAKEGKRDELIAILLEASKGISLDSGCIQYLIYKDAGNDTGIYVTEIWTGKEEHDHSLKAEGSKTLIAQAMPLLDGKPEGTSLEIAGGKGLHEQQDYNGQ